MARNAKIDAQFAKMVRVETFAPFVPPAAPSAEELENKALDHIMRIVDNYINDCVACPLTLNCALLSVESRAQIREEFIMAGFACVADGHLLRVTAA